VSPTAKRKMAPKRAKPAQPTTSARRQKAEPDLLFEIGVEELPTSYILPALQQLERGARAGLAELRLASAAVETWATPRRLTVFVSELAARQTDVDEEAMGPAVRVAFDAEGKPTRALLGFCQGKGVDPSEVRRVETSGRQQWRPVDVGDVRVLLTGVLFRSDLELQ